MKKNIASLLLICFCAAASFANSNKNEEFIIKLGLQPQGVFSHKGDHNTNTGLMTGFEYFKYLNNIVAIGGGTSYETPRSFQDDLDGSLSFMPFYMALKIRPPQQEGDINFPFFAAKLGYSPVITYGTDDWMRSSQGGLYYSFGAGINLNRVVLEGSYSGYTVSFTETATNKKYTEPYSVFAISIGYKFN